MQTSDNDYVHELAAAIDREAERLREVADNLARCAEWARAGYVASNWALANLALDVANGAKGSPDNRVSEWAALAESADAEAAR